MSAKQIEAYKTAQKTVMSGREIEASALTKAAMMLKEMPEQLGCAGSRRGTHTRHSSSTRCFGVYSRLNLMEKDNPLPKELREDILSLSAFIDKRIIDIMAFPSPEKLTAIININMSLAVGLRGEP